MASSDLVCDWPEAVIFDLDGTLIDSAPDVARAANQALAHYDITLDKTQARQFLGEGAEQFIKRALGYHGHKADTQTLQELTRLFSSHYRQSPCADSTVFPGVYPMLERLKRQGRRLALCTNKPRPVAELILRTMGLNRYLDAVIGAGDYALKPDPEPLIACMDRLSANPHSTLYIGDMAVDRMAGHAAGVQVILVEFGYAHEAVARLGAEGSLTDWSRLAGVIDRLRPG